MFALLFRFPAGRYHATPWGRHVNEAAVAWPPEPWRILRALVAVWHRKADHDRFPEPVLAGLIDRLAASLPRFRLPDALQAHTRHYMPWFKKGPDDRTLVFDGFMRLGKDDPLVVWWPDVALNAAERALADHLAENMAYLGRAESWVEASCAYDDPGRMDCVPAAESEGGGDGVRLLAPLTPDRWVEVRDALVPQAERLTRAKRTARMAVLGRSLLDAMRPDTADWRKEGFTLPPAAHFVVYRWSPPPVRRQAAGTVAGPKITTLRFVLAGKPLPLLTDAVRIAELMKETLMSHEGRRAGVSWQISGHDAPGSHQHAFFLPEDADDDGHIDHVTVHAEAGFSPSTVAACTAVREMWGGDFGTWRVVLERCGGRDTLAAAQVWESVTPYLHPLHAKARLGPEEQLRRELADRGLPAPCHVERLDHVQIAKRATKTVAFRRWRSKGGLTQPDTRGGFWRLTFDEQVSGPMAFGFACHYGLGMFRPAP